jgi:hypothetical protein
MTWEPDTPTWVKVIVWTAIAVCLAVMAWGAFLTLFLSGIFVA